MTLAHPPPYNSHVTLTKLDQTHEVYPPSRQKVHPLEPLEAARAAVAATVDKQAEDVLLLDLRSLEAFTDYFVICTAGNTRQMSAVANSVEKALEDLGGISPKRVGTDESGWVLLDYGFLLVHIFSPQRRNYYDLEQAWANAVQVVRIQ